MTDDGIKSKIQIVRSRIAEAAARSGRRPSEIRLMAVTKTVEENRIRQALEAGIDLCGENYIQESRIKIESIGHPPQWHMIGHLQTNKAKYAVRLFDMVESVDRFELAVELDRRAGGAGRVLPILIEVNSGGELTKSGIPPEEAIGLIRRIAPLEHLAISGLMTMPPWFDDPEEARPFFSALRTLRDRIAAEEFDRVAMTELSMGMTDDFEVAVEEGATIVRVGRGIFGERTGR
ncbi:YggS family pyridoxal phosphate-dependent enzyme [Syntrophus sp. (in: bacteria)]|uniref:YggS family pyridoxal phosphate-dependent enzyme n=1 Tax=Syntrophus sp. (in: bacteria) TaxID=48412 RepID=UPI00345E6EAF